MPDLPISGLPAATTPLAGTELAAIVQSGVTRRVAINEFGLQFVVDEQGSSPYADIQAAIDAAETRGVPASILVLDGDYTGFSLVGDRISIQGLSSLSQGVKITGNVTVTATAAPKQFVLSQMFIDGTLTLAGTSQLLLFMDHVEIQQSGGSSPVVMTNTNGGSTLIAQNLTASELGNTAPALDRSAGSMNLDCHDCEFSRNGASQSAFVAMDYSAGGTGVALMRNCKVLGQIDLSNSGLSLTFSGAAGQLVTAGTTACFKLTSHTGSAFVFGVNLAVISGGDVVDPNPAATFFFSNVIAGFGTLLDTTMGTRITVDGLDFNTEAGRLGLGGAPDASAKLAVASTTQGFLQPRVTTVQRDAISAPADGLSVHNTDRARPEFFDDAAWQQISVVAPTAIEIFTAADLDAIASGGVITFSSDTTLIIKGAITTSNRFVINGGALKFAAFNFEAGLTYSGTGTFISGTGGVASETVDLSSSSTGTLFALSNPLGLPNRLVNFQGVNSAGWTSMGSISDFDAAIFGACSFIFITDGFDLINTSLSALSVGYIGGTVPLNAGAFFRISGLETLSVEMTFQASALFSGAKLLRIDPDLAPDSEVNVVNNALRGDFLFDVSGGTTGTFTAVADAAVALTTINSVTDSGGIARFNFTVGPTMFVDQEVDIVNFVTQTNYNQKGIITATGVGFFEVALIAFTADDATGDFSSDSVTLTDALTSLSDGDTLVIDTDAATDYDSGATVYNQLTNSFQINRAFTVTQSGTWNTAGLDQKDPRVLAALNPTFGESKYICAAFVNDNATANGAIVNNTFTDMVFGTGGSALVASKVIERFKLIDELNGTFEYIGNEPFEGSISFDFTVTSAAATVDFRFKWVKDVGAGFVNLNDNVEALVAVSGSAESITKTFPICLVKGDQIKPQITRNSGTSGITTNYASIYATQ